MAGMPSHSTPVAAIDLGTNTALMLLARLDSSGRLLVMEDLCETTRLGAGLARSGGLCEAGMRRALEALLRFAALLDEHGVDGASCRVVATAVLRRANNSEPFIAQVARETGFQVEVISEADEARLGHQAVVGEGFGAETLIVDVGGGSTELAGRAGALRFSVPVGAVVLTELYLGLDGAPPVESGGFSALWDRAERELSSFPSGLARKAPEVVCLGGTATNLACLDLRLATFDPKRAEGHRFPRSAAREWALRLHNLPLKQRRLLPIEADRAEILPAGLACVAAALTQLQAQTARVSGKGIRYGVARELLLKSAP